MNILDKVQEVFNQHEFKPIKLPKEFKNLYMFLNTYPEFGKNFKSSIEDSELNKKYRKHIPKGWYGFDIGTPMVHKISKII